MATKKLKVELELETAKAKRQAKDLENPGGSVPGGGSAGGGAESSADNLAKSLDKAAASAGKFDSSTLAVVRSFTGIGVGLAANYAASHMKQGAARDAVEYGASAATGAGMGAMAGGRFGPWGALIGALVGGGGGLAKTWLDKSAEKQKYTEDWQKSEHDYHNSKQFADFLSSLTDAASKSKSFSDRISEAKEQLKHYQDVEKTLVDNVNKMVSQGRYDDATAQRGYLDLNRQRQHQLETTIKSLEAGQLKDVNIRTSTSGVDALAKIGGSFVSGNDYSRDMLRRADQQLEELKKINANTTKKEHATWA